MKTYRVTVSRDNNLWAAVIDGLPPHAVGATDTEHFADLETEVRDLIAGLTDAGPDSFGLEWHFRLGGRDVTKAVKQLMEAESRLEAAAADRD